MKNGLATVMTCSYLESGVRGLIPAGFIVFAECWAAPRPECRIKSSEALRVKAAAEGVSHVFNVRFQEVINGHPSNGEYLCIASGDAYIPI